jgi:hypothetical protein
MSNGVNKKTLIIIVAILIIIGLGAWGYIIYWNNLKKAREGAKASQKAGEAAEALTESALKGVLPSIETNPLENKPDINPADKANPFKDIKINPFE